MFYAIECLAIGYHFLFPPWPFSRRGYIGFLAANKILSPIATGGKDPYRTLIPQHSRLQ